MARRTGPARRLGPRLWSDHSRVWWTRRRRTRTPTVTPAPVTLAQTAYRGRLDDGSELTAHWITDPDVSWHQRPDTLFRLRFLVTNSGLTLTTGFLAYYRLNGGAWTQVTGSSSVVRAQGASGLNDGGATTEQLAGIGSFVAGSIDEADGAYASVDLLAGEQTELEGAYVIRSADTATGDEVEIRLQQHTTTAFAIYTSTPTLTVAETGALTDDFSAYVLGTDYLNGDDIGTRWRVDDLDGGSAEIVTFPAVGNNGLRIEPDDATNPGDSFSPLVWSHAAFGPADYEITASYQTSAQLRTGSAPAPSEMTWLLWGLCDSGHFYYLALRTDGWEIGKNVVVAGNPHQVMLATGTNPETDVAETVTVSVAVTISAGRPTIVARANDRLLAAVTDTDTTNAPNLVGVVGLYNRDARSLWDWVNVSPDITPHAVLETPPVRRVQYELLCMARLPQVSGAPILLTTDPIDWTSLEYTDELNQPQTLSVTCLVSSLTDAVKQRLRDPVGQPSELWLYRDSRLVFAGPMVGWRRQGDQLMLSCQGLLHYLRWMVLTTELVTTADQATIVQSLVDQWQVLESGHFGIDTSDIQATGISRDVEYKLTEQHNVGQRVEELGKKSDGFDIEVDPASRDLRLWYPTKGVDRSAGDDVIVIDQNVVIDRDIMCACGPGDVASEAFGTGTSAANQPLYSSQTNTEVRATFGRTGISGTFDGVSEQTVLDAFTAALITGRSSALLIPSPRTRVTPDTDLSRYDVGDTILYNIDDELGISGSFRLRKRSVTVSGQGQTEIAAHEFV